MLNKNDSVYNMPIFMLDKLKKFLNLLLELILPSRTKELALLQLTPESFFSKTSPADKKLLPDFIYAVFDYKNGTVKDVVWELKYGNPETAKRLLLPILSDELLSILTEKKKF